MAKGLEFDYVFVVGLSEDTFPSFRSVSEGGDEGKHIIVFYLMFYYQFL